MNRVEINQWVQDWMDEHSNRDDPDDYLDNHQLRVSAVSILQFARDAGLITMDEYQVGLNPIVSRTHPELGEVFLTSNGKSSFDD